MDELDNLMSSVIDAKVSSQILTVSFKLDEAAKHVSEATGHVNNISSHSSQLKLQLSKTHDLYSHDTSVALKQTAENLLHLLTVNAKENVDKQLPTEIPFLEFVSFSSKLLFRKTF